MLVRRTIGVASAVLIMTACDSPQVVTVSDPVETTLRVTTTTAADLEDPVTTTAATTTTAPSRAGVGDSLTLRGSAGVEVRVTVEDVFDPATPPGNILDPDEGHRFVAVVLLIENVGTAIYDDWPLNGASLIDDQHQGHSSSLFADSPDCVKYESVRLSPGDQRRGCVLFELRDDLMPARLQWTPETFGSQTGEWDL